MADMLVKLYNIEDGCPELEESLKKEGIHIVKALSPDKHRVLDFVQTFSEGWRSECEAAFANNPHTIYIAVKDQKVIGFAAYEATARGYFGPTGVSGEFRKKGIGRLLMLKCFHSMKELGYGYAIIGWAARSAIPFYEKFAQARIIEDSHPGVYSRMTKVVTQPAKDESN
ncbi:MAG: GNAT family N-acetyltransferase [Clostridia bacterium]|nr:GNAT family N-acetyltransferase [Clostridia bacterium]